METMNQFKKHIFQIFLFLCIFFLGNLHSQDAELKLNQEFLDSLPEDTRNELLKQLEDDQDELDEVDFGVISTMMSKTPAQRFIEQELLEKSGKNIPSQYLGLDQLEIFGIDFFAGLLPSTFMPTSEPSLSGEYVLDIGDILNINIIGYDKTFNSIVITQDGNVMLPQIGSLKLAGLSLNEAKITLDNFLNQKVPGSKGIIQLESLRNIQVVVVGFVEVPGIYTLSGNSNILSALRAAGGISEEGSFRSIAIKRNGDILKEYDLYDLMINGNLTLDTSLRSGDSIIVSSSGTKVSVYGGVAKPAIYEAKKNESIKDLLKFSGFGLNGRAIESVTLSRLEGYSRESTNILPDAFDQNIVQDSDQIYVPFLEEPPFNGVTLVGAFLNPGIYSVDQINSLQNFSKFAKESYSLSLILKRASSKNNYQYLAINPLQKIKFLPGDTLIAFFNNDIKYLQSQNLRDFFNNLDQDLVSNNCAIYDYLSNIKDTGRFLRAQALYDNNEFLDTSTNNASDPFISRLSQSDSMNINNELFIDKNSSSYNEVNCPKIFLNDPELLIATIQNSILIDGSSVQGGLFPIYSDIKLKKIFENLSFNYPLNGNELISVTGQESSSLSTLNELSGETITHGSNITISSPRNSYANKVTISGEVNMPGVYYISQGDRLSNLIKTSGGYTKNAFPLGGHLSRVSARKFEIDFNDRLYKDIIKNLSSEIVTGGQIPYETISFILNEFKSIKPAGRVIAEFNESILAKNIESDIILENGDEIFIPKKSNVVYVFGEVLNPGPQVYSIDNDVNDYINSAGGFTRLVDSRSVILVFPDGKSKLIKNGFFKDSEYVIPGSVIYASRDLRKLDNLTLASTLAPIVSSIAISLASLNSISNN